MSSSDQIKKSDSGKAKSSSAVQDSGYEVNCCCMRRVEERGVGAIKDKFSGCSNNIVDPDARIRIPFDKLNGSIPNDRKWDWTGGTNSNKSGHKGVYNKGKFVQFSSTSYNSKLPTFSQYPRLEAAPQCHVRLFLDDLNLEKFLEGMKFYYSHGIEKKQAFYIAIPAWAKVDEARFVPNPDHEATLDQVFNDYGDASTKYFSNVMIPVDFIPLDPSLWKADCVHRNDKGAPLDAKHELGESRTSPIHTDVCPAQKKQVPRFLYHVTNSPCPVCNRAIQKKTDSEQVEKGDKKDEMDQLIDEVAEMSLEDNKKKADKEDGHAANKSKDEESKGEKSKKTDDDDDE